MNTVMRTVGGVIGGQLGAALLTAYTIGATGVPAEHGGTRSRSPSAPSPGSRRAASRSSSRRRGGRPASARRSAPRTDAAYPRQGGRSSARSRSARVHRLAVRDEHVLDVELEQGAQRREDALLMPGRIPDEQLRPAAPSGRPRRAATAAPAGGGRLVAPAPVVEGSGSARERRAGLDLLKLCPGYVRSVEDAWPVGRNAVALDEEIDAADVVGLHDDDCMRRLTFEPRPEVVRLVGRRERVDQHRAALGGVREGCDPRLPAEAGLQSGWSSCHSQRPGATSRISSEPGSATGAD